MKACCICRPAISWNLDGTKPLPAWVQRHVSHCAECRRFYSDQLALTSALSAGAQSEGPADLPPFLHSRIVAGLRRETAVDAAPLSLGFWIRAALLPALGVLGAVAYVSYTQPPTQPRPATHLVSAALQMPADSEEDAPDPAALLSWAENFNQPLERELNLVFTDAKSALEGLRENFLPR